MTMDGSFEIVPAASQTAGTMWLLADSLRRRLDYCAVNTNR